MAPRKVRLVADVVRGLSVYEAEAQLMMMRQRAAVPLLKLLRSAMANAKNQNAAMDTLVIKTARVDQGPMVKRFLPRAKGMATPLHKISSHVLVTLVEGNKKFKPRFMIIPKEKKGDRKKSGASKTAIVSKKAQPEAKAKKKLVEETGIIRKIFRRKTIA